MAKDSTVSKAMTKSFSFWQDREIRFDVSPVLLRLRERAEYIITSVPHTEDTRGNNGAEGTLVLTNLRIIWWHNRSKHINISIGYYCITKFTMEEATSKLRGGSTEAVYVNARYGASRFQFVFTVCSASRGGKASPVTSLKHRQPIDAAAGVEHRTLYLTLQSIQQAYEKSRIFREVRVRSSIISEGHLVLLSSEAVISKHSGICNVSKENGHMGTFIVTNIRVVWFSQHSAEFNVSVPYFQFIALRIMSSKFGDTLVIETSSYAKDYVLGFQVSPLSRLQELYLEVGNMWKAWATKPILGTVDPDVTREVSRQVQEAMKDLATAVEETQGEGVVIDPAPSDAFAAYYADPGCKSSDRRPVYDKSIGLAVEKIRGGVTLQGLWSVPTS